MWFITLYLVGDLALRALRGVALVLVDEGLHHPLVAEGGEPGRLVVQLMEELLRTVGLQLEVCDTFFVKVVSAPLLSSLNITCDNMPGIKSLFYKGTFNVVYPRLSALEKSPM